MNEVFHQKIVSNCFYRVSKYWKQPKNICQQLNKPIAVYLYNGLLHNNDGKSTAAPWEIMIRKINQAQRNIYLPQNLCDVCAHVLSCV